MCLLDLGVDRLNPRSIQIICDEIGIVRNIEVIQPVIACDHDGCGAVIEDLPYVKTRQLPKSSASKATMHVVECRQTRNVVPLDYAFDHKNTPIETRNLCDLGLSLLCCPGIQVGLSHARTLAGGASVYFL